MLKVICVERTDSNYNTPILVEDEHGTVVNKFADKQTLERWCKFIDKELEPSVTRNTTRNGNIETYKLDCSVKVIKVKSVNEVPSHAVKCRGLFQSIIIDMYIQTDKSVVTIYYPYNPLLTEGFNYNNVGEETESKFFKTYGMWNSEKFIDDPIGQMARLGDVWYEILGIRNVSNGLEFMLHSKTYWVSLLDITDIQPKDKIGV